MQIKIFLIPVTRAMIGSSTPTSLSAGSEVVENGWIDVTGVVRYTHKYFKFHIANSNTQI